MHRNLLSAFAAAVLTAMTVLAASAQQTQPVSPVAYQQAASSRSVAFG